LKQRDNERNNERNNDIENYKYDFKENIDDKPCSHGLTVGNSSCRCFDDEYAQ
jgi:hypothetical protein